MKSTFKLLTKLFFYLFIYAVTLLAIGKAYSQPITQVLKGKVFDIESQETLPGANIIIVGTNPLLGTTSDVDGNFKIPNAPLGRHSIQISFVGYDPVVIPEILITSGKEVVLNVGLKQTINQINEVVVKAHSRKDKPMNPMASISAKSFTVEETRRYAGGLDDPARMVSAFAGVTVGNIQDNAIIIRGNSPKGVSWRLEGVEIPNPNHFAGGNVAGGGAVTIMSGQLLANSDFFTGAFPAEYGNALAGVFDMKLRVGNNETWEHTFQAGVMGIDFASEGPFRKGGRSSYLFNYRYSTFGLLNRMNIIPSSQVPEYQDLSFKLNFPTKKAGTFSIWGIGAVDYNVEPEERDSSTWNFDWDRIAYVWNLNMGAVGINHRIITGERTYINTALVGSGTQNIMDSKRFDNNLILQPNGYFLDKSSKLTLCTFLNHKISARHTVKTGVNYSSLFYNLKMSGTVDYNPDNFQNFVDRDGVSGYAELYAQSKYSVTKNLTLNTGINFNYFELSRNYSIDPRASLKWDFAQNHSIAFGYGKHSQLEELKIYLIYNDVNGENHFPNKNLELSKAHHFVLAYDWLINENLRLKTEPYFQYLYDIPGIPNSSYSMINFKQDWGLSDSLANNSTGKNLGIDITFERFLNNNYYYLVTASVFDSKYKGDDGVLRNTRYDKGFAVNLLFGKEFFLSKNRVLGLNARLSLIGGERFSPILTEESIQQAQVVYDETRAFEEQSPATYNFDLSITYRMNKSRYSGIWALQVKNLLGSPMDNGYMYNFRTGGLERWQEKVMVPV
ncbi:MAG TPA: TonB-dependent receptor, partial [Tenuifilaceae bacterium]|nr:TonB-dependent receptor [Tenuifilaceae bacterium]